MFSQKAIWVFVFLAVLGAGGFVFLKKGPARSPAQVAAQEAPSGAEISLSGQVKPESMVRSPDGKTLGFTVTDGHNDVPVIYTGSLPMGFCEGQGLTVRGNMQENKSLSAHTLEIPPANKC